MLALDGQDLARLAADRGELRLSLFLPTRHREPLRWRNRVRGKDLVQQAGRSMEEHGFSVAHVREVVESALDILDETWLWQRPQSAVALFAGSGRTRCFWLPLTLPELVTFGDRFVVSPLLPMLRTGSRFVAMTLQQDEVRLYRGEGARMAECLTDDPAFTGLRWMPSPESGEERGPADIQRHLRVVDQALGEPLRNSDVPLVLLGEHRLQALYSEISEHHGPLLLTPGTRVAEMSHAQLHRLAYSAARVELRREEDAALESYRARGDEGRTVTDVEQLLTAAEQGDVETLLISTDVAPWEQRTGASSIISLRESPVASYHVEVAAAAVLRHSGMVVTVARERMPGCSPMAGALRY